MNFKLSAFAFLLLVANEIGALGKQIKVSGIYDFDYDPLFSCETIYRRTNALVLHHNFSR